MNGVAHMLGTSLLKKETKKEKKMKTIQQKNQNDLRRAKKRITVVAFLREILGTSLVQIEKKF